MSKVLKITKPDKTVHTAPLSNKAFYLHFNSRLTADKKWKIEEIEESEVESLPFRDNDYVTGIEAVEKLKEKDTEIEALKAKLAALQAVEPAAVLVDPTADANQNAPLVEPTTAPAEPITEGKKKK
jgi:hypothetical protein